MTNAWVMRPLRPLSVTASSTAVGYDPAFVLNDHGGMVWKSTAGATGQTLDFDMGSAVAIDAALFFGCTAAATGWQLTTEAANNPAFTLDYWVSPGLPPFLAGAEFPAHGRGVGYWEAAAAAPPPARRYWRFIIGGLGGAVVTIARVALGNRVLLERNFAFGGAWGVRDLGRVDFSPAGVLTRRRAARLRTIGIAFPALRKDEVEAKVQPLIELAAAQEAVVLVTDPAAHAMRQRRCWMGFLAGDLGTVWRAANAWEWRANLVDLIPIPAQG